MKQVRRLPLFNRLLLRLGRTGVMSAEEFYKQIFNPAAAVAVGSDGRCDLKECAVADSHVIVADKIYCAYHYDENFEHKKLLNPDNAKDYRKRHDFILVNVDNSVVEVFLLEMKSSKDDFQHVKNQLQGGIALMSFVQRMGIDKGADLSSFAKVRFYAATLFHTKRLPDVTKMERLKEELDRREAEQKRYAGILGIICVQNNKITLEQLREGCKQVSLDWRKRNDFSEFP